MLTSAQHALKDDIKAAHTSLTVATETYWKLKTSCTAHVYQHTGDSAICAICSNDGGWWCPDSATHVCTYEKDEWCIHCGHPSERA